MSEVIAFVIWLVAALNVLVLGYFVLLNGGYLITTVLAMTALRRHAKRAERADITDVLTSGAPNVCSPRSRRGATAWSCATPRAIP